MGGPGLRSREETAVVERGYGATLRRLKGAQKPPAAGSPAYSRFVNRRLGRFIAAGAYELGLTPNQVTAISATFSATGIVLIATVSPSWWLAVGVALLLLTGYAFDSADGQLARLRGGGSPAGEWLDHVVDCAKISALHGAVLISLFRFGDLDSNAWLLLPMAYWLVDNLGFFAMILNDQLKRVHAGPPAPVVGKVGSTRSLLVLPTDYGVLCIAFVLLGSQPAFLAGYGLLLAANAGYLLLALPTWFRQMGALAHR